MEKEISEDSYCTTDEGEDKSKILNIKKIKFMKKFTFFYEK